MARSRERRRGALAGIAAIAGASLGACNLLTGVSDYEKSYCEPLCDGAIPPLDAGGDAPDGADLDAPIDADDPGEPSLLTRWARWRMPNRADAGLPNPMRIASDGGPELRDDVTGLTWWRTASDPLSYEGAVRHCANLPPARTWRVPTRIELVSVLDEGHDPMIPPPFEGSQRQLLLTASLAGLEANGDRSRWVVDLTGPLFVRTRPMAGLTGQVFCVRGGAP